MELRVDQPKEDPCVVRFHLYQPQRDQVGVAAEFPNDGTVYLGRFCISRRGKIYFMRESECEHPDVHHSKSGHILTATNIGDVPGGG